MEVKAGREPEISDGTTVSKVSTVDTINSGSGDRYTRHGTTDFPGDVHRSLTKHKAKTRHKRARACMQCIVYPPSFCLGSPDKPTLPIYVHN